MLYSFQKIGSGYAGAKDTVQIIKQLIYEGSRHPIVIAQARDIIGSVQEKKYIDEVKAIHYWVQDNMRYTKDPAYTELVTTPWQMILDIKEKGSTHGDCDDFVILAGALLTAVGHRVRLATLSEATKDHKNCLSHIYLQVEIDGKWMSADGILKNKAMGYDPKGTYKEYFSLDGFNRRRNMYTTHSIQKGYGGFGKTNIELEAQLKALEAEIATNAKIAADSGVATPWFTQKQKWLVSWGLISAGAVTVYKVGQQLLDSDKGGLNDLVAAAANMKTMGYSDEEFQNMIKSYNASKEDSSIAKWIKWGLGFGVLYIVLIKTDGLKTLFSGIGARVSGGRSYSYTGDSDKRKPGPKPGSHHKP